MLLLSYVSLSILFQAALRGLSESHRVYFVTHWDVILVLELAFDSLLAGIGITWIALRWRLAPIDIAISSALCRRDVFVAIAGAVALVIWALTIDELSVALGYSVPERYDHIARLLSSKSQLIVGVTVLLAAFVGPAVEEVVFRGLVWMWLSQRYDRVAVWVVSSLLFGAIHVYPEMIVFGVGAGVILAAMRSLTNSLRTSILGHTLYNLMFIAEVLGFWNK